MIKTKYNIYKYRLINLSIYICLYIKSNARDDGVPLMQLLINVKEGHARINNNKKSFQIIQFTIS